MKKSKGLSVIIKNEEQFNIMRKFLGEDILYLDYVPQMVTTETAIVIWAKKKTNFSTGSVGSSVYQKAEGIKCVKFRIIFAE